MPAGRRRRPGPGRADDRHRAAPGAGARSGDRQTLAVRGVVLFGHVGAFVYEGDTPLAERRAAALSLDTTPLAELLGRVELREYRSIPGHRRDRRQLQHLSADRAARDAERSPTCCDCGPPPKTRSPPGPASPTAPRSGAGWRMGAPPGARGPCRCRPQPQWWPSKTSAGSATESGAAAAGVPATFTGEVADPLGELLGRYARTHTPFTTAGAAAYRPGTAGDGRRAGPAGQPGDSWRPAGRRGVLRRRPQIPGDPGHPPAAPSNGATPTCCGFCGGVRWRRCAPRSSR